MSNLRPPLFAAASLVVLLAGPLLAQNDVRATPATPVDTMADVLVLDQDYTGAEYVRVFLESGQVYRAELSSRDITLQIRAVGDRIRAPRPYPILGPESASEASVVELYPDRDGEYEIRAIALNGVAVSTHLRLYRDVAESHRRLAVMNKPGWEIGMELAGGWHSGFAQTSAFSAGDPDPHGGTDIEACFTARTETGRTGLCAFGIGYQSQVGERSILWFFTEPRFMLVGRRSKSASTWEAGALFRVGLGSIERMSETPVMLAPGVYIARQIRSGEHGARWSLKGSYSHAWYSGFQSPFGTTSPQPHGDRLTLGLGWYQ
jgi:hypothetical protein